MQRLRTDRGSQRRLLRRALSREPVDCDPWAAWDPLPSPDSSKRRMANGAQTAAMGERTNGVQDTGMPVMLRMSCMLASPGILHSDLHVPLLLLFAILGQFEMCYF